MAVLGRERLRVSNRDKAVIRISPGRRGTNDVKVHVNAEGVGQYRLYLQEVGGVAGASGGGVSGEGRLMGCVR